MLRLALAGGLLSGKSTLARYLVNEHDFAYVNYTDMLKGFASAALKGIGLDVSVADMQADKEKYRAFIIECGTLLGFDQGYGIEELVELMDAQKLDKVVFDCVRFDAQYEKLQAAGFRLVRVNTPYTVRLERARAKGMTAAEFDARLADPTEAPLSHYPGEVSISVVGPMDDICNTLTGRILKAQVRERRVERRTAAESGEAPQRSEAVLLPGV